MLRKILLSLLVLSFFVTGAESRAEKYVVATDCTFPPMEYLDDQKQPVGFDPAIIKEIAKASGFEVDVQNIAWDGIFAGVAAGKYEIVASGVSITPERQKAFDLSDPYYDVYPTIITMAGSSIKKPSDLNGKKVGGQIGTTGLVETLPKAKSKAIVKTYDEVGLALEDLAKGNIDAVICDDPVAKFYANKKQEYAGKLKVAFITDDVEFYGFAVRKSDTDLVKKLNEGIKAVKEKGIDKQVVEKWIGK